MEIESLKTSLSNLEWKLAYMLATSPLLLDLYGEDQGRKYGFFTSRSWKIRSRLWVCVFVCWEDQLVARIGEKRWQKISFHMGDFKTQN